MGAARVDVEICARRGTMTNTHAKKPYANGALGSYRILNTDTQFLQSISIGCGDGCRACTRRVSAHNIAGKKWHSGLMIYMAVSWVGTEADQGLDGILLHVRMTRGIRRGLVGTRSIRKTSEVCLRE